MAGQGDALPIKCRSCRPQASVRPQTGFTGDLETGPLVKSQSSRPEEFNVQETRAWGGRGCLEVKVEPSDSVDLRKIYYTGFTRWCLNWVNRVRSYVCVCAIQRDVYESDCGTIWVRDSKSNTCWGVSQSILSIHPSVPEFIFSHLSSLSTPLPLSALT